MSTSAQREEAPKATSVSTTAKMSFSAQEEEALKATIISHASVVYGPNVPAGSVFDVVSSCTTQGRYISYIVVYPKTEPPPAGQIMSGKCSLVLVSHENENVLVNYEQLLRHLRSLVAVAILT